MRPSVFAIVGLLLAMSVGCESGPPPPAADIGEATPPSPPEPARPPEPVAKTAPVDAAGPPVTNVETAGQAAIARAKAAREKQNAAKDGTPTKDPVPAEGNPPAEPMPPAQPPGDQPPGDAPGEGDQLTKAEVGVGVKGKNYGGPGFVTTPIETLFRVEDRIAFEVQIPNTMKIYKAGHDNKGPQTHEEFMEVIIKENGVKLPELPEGSAYWYDAKTEQLMVRTAKPAA